jgi:hypothetical protein
VLVPSQEARAPLLQERAAIEKKRGKNLSGKRRFCNGEEQALIPFKIKPLSYLSRAFFISRLGPIRGKPVIVKEIKEKEGGVRREERERERKKEKESIGSFGSRSFFFRGEQIEKRGDTFINGPLFFSASKVLSLPFTDTHRRSRW